jgi:hypothetical protein
MRALPAGPLGRRDEKHLSQAFNLQEFPTAAREHPEAGTYDVISVGNWQARP